MPHLFPALLEHTYKKKERKKEKRKKKKELTAPREDCHESICESEILEATALGQPSEPLWLR